MTRLLALLVLFWCGTVHAQTPSFTPSAPYDANSNGKFNLIGSTKGTTLASATTIAPVSDITHITGTTAIATITLPVTGWVGCIRLIPDGLWTTTTSGNIAIASTAVVSKALEECYDGTKWYPSY